jgi:hypothetical protein
MMCALVGTPSRFESLYLLFVVRASYLDDSNSEAQL